MSNREGRKREREEVNLDELAAFEAANRIPILQR